MGPQPMGKVPDLRRLAGGVAPRSKVPWSWLWAFLELCLLAAVVGGPAVDLLHARVAAAVAGIRRSARGPAGLWQTITFGQLPGTAVGQQVSLTASSVTTTTSPPVGTGLARAVRRGHCGPLHGSRLHRRPGGARFLRPYRGRGRHGEYRG
jgi:hypothetical protein